MADILPGSSSMQDYLKAILEITEKNGSARVSDIASRLDVTKPSVTQMVNNLENKGLVKQEPYGPVGLTAAGRELAIRVRERHMLLEKFLVEVLGVAMEIAQRDACMIEHVVSPQTMEKLVEYLANVSL
ncbi:MAG: metal-dependent transcriptional regulator [Firmicutes bacterium]|nr:metal-dependent transcriptional regulator [Bacillota bacterium]